MAARLANSLRKWKRRNAGVATLSFTNVAWQEIALKLSENFGVHAGITYPHYLGTIDSFVNKFIFLPHGHLIMDCRCRPTLVGPPHGHWHSGKYERDYDKYFGITSFDLNGDLISTTADSQAFHFSWKCNKDGKPNGHVVNVAESKWKYFKKGYATQADANYLASLVLRKFPGIAKALSYRFPAFIIDEAQDTSAIQMSIIDSLINAGVKEIGLVGDPDQAIFEWNRAEPRLLNEKFEGWEAGSRVLNQNRRSSQTICNFTCKLSSLPTPSISIANDLEGYKNQPEIWTYNENDLNRTVEGFLASCRDNSIEQTPTKVAVLARSSGIISVLCNRKVYSNQSSPWLPQFGYVRDFVEGKYLFENGQFRKGFRSMTIGLCGLVYDSPSVTSHHIREFINKNGFLTTCKASHELLKNLPSTKLRLADWIQNANNFFVSRGKKLRLQIAQEYAECPISDLFQQPFQAQKHYRVGTIHSVKGETFEACLVFLRSKGKGPYYTTLLSKGGSLSDSEELRIVYVAITRPRKLLVIAVPDEANRSAWKKCFNL